MRGVRIWILGWCIGFGEKDFSGYRGLGLGIIFCANLELGKSSEKFYDLAFGTEISHHE
jgi:hypothetical protein